MDRPTRRRFVAATLILLLVESAIARWLADPLIRPYGGDALAVVLVHCGLRAATRLPARIAALAAFGIAAAIELSQLVHLVDQIGLGGSAVARAVQGTGFDPHDFIAYGIGVLLALTFDAAITPRRRSRS